MMLRFSLKQPKLAELLENAVSKVLQDGFRTRDIVGNDGGNYTVVGTKEMGDAVVARLKI